MKNFGCTLTTEQSGLKDLVRWAIEIIRELRAGGPVTYRGQHCDVDSAEVWDLPLVQVDGEAQQRFLAEAANPLPERPRAAAP